jgi:succinyl-diaminopimelate desuccinylase
VAVEGGVAGNVVPDRAAITVNLRFAPDRGSEEAVEDLVRHLAPFLEDGDRVEVTEVAEAAWPAVDHPLLTPLTKELGLAVEPKLGWTDVARFAAQGIPAVNVGVGNAALAHTRDEVVTAQELAHVAGVLRTLLRVA